MVMEAIIHESAEHDIVEEIDTEHEIRIANHFNTRTAIFSRLDILAINLRWLSDHRIFIIELVFWQYSILSLILPAVEDISNLFKVL